MTSPRWTYGEANAVKWKPLFDSLITGQLGETEIPLAGNARSLCSLKIRLGDAIKWLADQYSQHHNEAFRVYAELKPRLRFGSGNTRLIVRVRPNIAAMRPLANEAERPMNLDLATIKRIIVMSRDPSQTDEARQKFAAVVRRELELRCGETALEPNQWATSLISSHSVKGE